MVTRNLAVMLFDRISINANSAEQVWDPLRKNILPAASSHVDESEARLATKEVCRL